MAVVFIFVNYNNTAFTESAVDSILYSDSKGELIVIVDNNSSNEELLKLRLLDENHDNVEVIYNNENLGYFQGLNVGIRYARLNLHGFECLIIGNNDLLFPPDFYSSVSECIHLFQDYPVISPNITLLDGTAQNPHVVSGISKLREIVYDFYHFSYFSACVITKIAKLTKRFTDRKDELLHDQAQEICQGYGACYIIGPKFFDFFEELWAPTFLMYEEFFLSKQLESVGCKIYYEPSISVQHCGHASTGDLPGKVKWEFSKKAHKEYRKFVKIFR